MLRPVFLIGFMASGKSTLGRALACATGGPFVDLDELVESAFGMSVADIFATAGEATFRHAESHALAQAASIPGAIVACGGGTPCRTENMELMLEKGTVVWLRASREATLRRLLLAPKGLRPKVEQFRSDPERLAAEMAALEEARLPHYSRAHICFASDLLETKAEIDMSVKRLLQQLDLFAANKKI